MSNSTDQPTVFGPGCHIKGELAIEGDGVVLGSIQGAVHATGSLDVGESGGISGGVVAGAMVVNGRVEGDVHCDGLLELNGRIEGDVVCGKIEIGPDATLVGNLRAKIIAVAEGAIYRGEVIIGPDAMDEAPAEAAEQPEAEVHAEHNGHAEITTAQSRTAVSGLLRKRHELLNAS